jgi:ATP-dependent Lon protease
MPEEALKEANRELSRLEKLPSASPEYSIIRTYLELLVSLPWGRSTGEKIDVSHARQVLDEDHYDLQKIKERILEYLAVRHLKEERQQEEEQREREQEEAESQIELEETGEKRRTQPLLTQ